MSLTVACGKAKNISGQVISCEPFCSTGFQVSNDLSCCVNNQPSLCKGSILQTDLGADILLDSTLPPMIEAFVECVSWWEDGALSEKYLQY
jgi:hypothetical protein